MKIIRGTIIDPFQYTADRKLDRESLAWFEGLLATLDFGGHSSETCKAILAAPMDIRGYGPVREEADEKVRHLVEELLQETERTAA